MWFRSRFILLLWAAVALLGSQAVIQAGSLTQATATAQATDIPSEPQTVQVAAADGVTLVGDYWALLPSSISKSGAPAVLVVHQLYSYRKGGLPLVKPLLQAGYNVLFIDIRDSGDTPGPWDAPKSIADMQTWLDWLRQQPGVQPTALATLGSSVGGTLALIGCANDKQCVTAIALSASLEIVGLSAKTALTDGLRNRAVLLIVAQEDTFAAATRQMIALAQGEVGVRFILAPITVRACSGSPSITAASSSRLSVG